VSDSDRQISNLIGLYTELIDQGAFEELADLLADAGVGEVGPGPGDGSEPATPVLRGRDRLLRLFESTTRRYPGGTPLTKHLTTNLIVDIDEALGRVLRRIGERGWGDDVDVLFTSDHGDFAGDFGLLFKGPYHVDSLMRLPLVWRPAPSCAPAPTVMTRPVGLVDLAPTFCAIAGLAPMEWMQGRSLPVDDEDARVRGFEQALTEWDSELFGVEVHLRTITREGWVCTSCLPGTCHDGTEGELYDLSADPLQQVNRWDDSGMHALRDDLLADLFDHQPVHHTPRLQLEAPV